MVNALVDCSRMGGPYAGTFSPLRRVRANDLVSCHFWKREADSCWQSRRPNVGTGANGESHLPVLPSGHKYINAWEFAVSV